MTQLVAIYTSPSCRRCPDTKRFLDDNNIPWIEKSIVEDEHREYLVESGFQSVPVIEFAPGFDGAIRSMFDGTDRELLNKLARTVLSEDEVWS